MKPLHQSFASPSGTVSLDPRSPGGGKIRARHSSGESDAPSPCPSSKAGGDDEGYKAQRSRNNEAVRKSRERTKVKSQNAEQRLEHLKTENGQLESRVKTLTEELAALKEFFIAQTKDHVRRSLSMATGGAGGVAPGASGAMASSKGATDGRYETLQHVVINIKREKEMRKNIRISASNV